MQSEAEDFGNVETLWRRYSNEIKRYLLRCCGDLELADDLTAETFLHAAQALRRGTEVNAGWLTVVARRRLTDHWRRSYRAAALHKRVALGRAEEVVIEAEVNLDGSLEQALGRLCRSQQTGLLLRYGLDHSVQQVADHLELSYAAAESLLSRGRRRLQHEYASIGGTGVD